MYRMRLVTMLVVASLATAPALAENAPYYGPKGGLLGEGYKEELQKDGSWRIVTEYHSRDPMVAFNIALYRAAELAKEAGKPFVEITKGYAMSGYGVANGFVFARPSDSPSAPAKCRTKRCYTADVAKVLKALGGPDGNQPGVPVPSIHENGRTVIVSGYGIGAIAWKPSK